MNERAEFRRKAHRSEQKHLDKQHHLQQHGGKHGAISDEEEEKHRRLRSPGFFASSLAATQASAEAATALAMKDPSARTKVVVRHLPPSLPKAAFLEHIESRLAGLYDWICFYPGKSSHKGHVYSRAYIDFKRPEDVLEFYDVFDGHIFLNKKGTQYKALVEYAPYQRVPKTWSKKDVREGTISKDPEYLEFLEKLAKPVEYLPSAEVQLERKEAERAASLASNGVKETVVVTPLMEFVRHKRASKAAPQRSLSMSGKLSARGGGLASTSSSNITPKRGVERSRSIIMYLPSKAMSRQKEKSAYLPRREGNHRREREFLIEKKRKTAFELKEKKLMQEDGSPKLGTGNQAEACEDDLLVKYSHEASLGEDSDRVGLLVAANDDQYGSRGYAVGKGSSNFDATNDTGRDGGDLTKKKQLLSREKYPHNGAAGGNLILTGGAGSRVSTPQHGSTTLAKSFSGSQSVPATLQQGGTSPGIGVSLTSGLKQSQHREIGIRSGRGLPSSRDPVSLRQSASHATLPSDSRNQQAEEDKQPLKSQAFRANVKESSSGPVSPRSSEVEPGLQHTNAISSRPMDDGRRVRNKDRPDRPVWTVRHRADTIAGPEPTSFAVSSVKSPTGEIKSSKISNGSGMKHEKGTFLHSNGEKSALGTESGTGEKGIEFYHDIGQESDNHNSGLDSGSSFTGFPVHLKIRKRELVSRVSKLGHSKEPVSHQGDMKTELVLLSRSLDVKAQGIGRNMNPGNDIGDNPLQIALFSTDKERRKQETSAYWNDTGGNGQVRRDRNSRPGAMIAESSSSLPEGTKPVKRGGGASAHGSHEKQVWVAKSGSVS